MLCPETGNVNSSKHVINVITCKNKLIVTNKHTCTTCKNQLHAEHNI